MNEMWLSISRIYSEQGQELSRKSFEVANLDVKTNTAKVTHIPTHGKVTQAILPSLFAFVLYIILT